MKCQIGADADSDLLHTVAETAAKDVTLASASVHGQERDVFADAGYQGVTRREEVHGSEVNWHVAMRPDKGRALDKNSPMGAILKQLEHIKARIRAKVEHPLRVIKRQVGYIKVKYRGLAKNTAKLMMLFALSNLWMARRRFLQGLQGCVRLPSANRPVRRVKVPHWHSKVPSSSLGGMSRLNALRHAGFEYHP